MTTTIQAPAPVKGADHRSIDTYAVGDTVVVFNPSGTGWPWDGGTKNLQTGRSIQQLMEQKGFRVSVNRQLNVADGINAVRTLFPQLYFDQNLCADGLQYLRRYQWGPATALGVARREPLHDDASHPADALRTLAVGIKEPQRKREETEKLRRGTPTNSGGWMS